MLRPVLPPLIVAYAIFLLLVVNAWRRPAPRSPMRSWLGPRRNGLVRYLAITVAGGYVVFLVIVVVFHSWLAGEIAAIGSALTEGSVLALVVFGLFATSAWSPTRSR
jgi:hypothetical protein